MGVYQGSSRIAWIFSWHWRRWHPWSLVHVGILGTLKREVWCALLEDARKARSWGIDEPKDELVENYPKNLEELLSTPIQSKGNLLFIAY